MDLLSLVSISNYIHLTYSQSLSLKHALYYRKGLYVFTYGILNLFNQKFSKYQDSHMKIITQTITSVWQCHLPSLGLNFLIYTIWKYCTWLTGLVKKIHVKNFEFQHLGMSSINVRYCCKICQDSYHHNYWKAKCNYVNICFLFYFITRPEECGGWEVMTMGKYALTYLPLVENVIHS